MISSIKLDPWNYARWTPRSQIAALVGHIACLSCVVLIFILLESPIPLPLFLPLLISVTGTVDATLKSLSGLGWGIVR